MRIIYVYTAMEKDLSASGEGKKALMQSSALQSNGIDSSVFYHDRRFKNNKILVRIPFYPIYGKSFVNRLIGELEDCDGVYIRKYVIDRSFIRMLKRIRNKFPHKPIVFEVPTYPYDKEFESLVDFPLLMKEKINRNKLNRYIDRIVTFSKDESIFGISCINTSNGIDCNMISAREVRKQEENTIRLLGVANVEKWHGYDRLIRGLSEYYSSKQSTDLNIVFDLVGNGVEIPFLKRLAKDLKVSDKVYFYGALSGNNLAERYDEADIGIGSLGMHRIGMKDGYTLKLREYMARGLPFIYAYDDELIEDNCDGYFIKYPNDDSAIDVNRIVEFYKETYSRETAENISYKMHSIAAEKLTWKEQMKPIAKYFESKLYYLKEE